MSFANNHHEKSYVITYKELIFTFFVFAAILFVLYPKDLLKGQIMSQKSSYDLSMLYLKNLIEHSPDDEELQLILAEQSLRSGNRALSLKLLHSLIQSDDTWVRQRATLLKYELEKVEYYSAETKKEKAQKKRELRRLFIMIYTSKMYSLEALDKWYNESIFVNYRLARHYFLNLKLKKDPTNVALLESDYYLESELGHYDAALESLIGLRKYDYSSKRDKWVMAEYYTYINKKAYVDAEKLLLEFAQKDDKYKKTLASFYIMRRDYKRASLVYEGLSKSSKDYKQKRKFFFKAVKTLQAGNLLHDASQKVKEYEEEYIDDTTARNFMLKTYMATGRLDYASNLSKRILRESL